MKANAEKRRTIPRSAVIAATLALLVVAGCTGEDPGQAISDLLGDLAGQLLTFWIL